MNKYFKQYNLRWLGTFINLVYMSMPILGIATNVMEAGTFYGVQKVNIRHFAPWMTFPVFMCFVIIVGLLILVGFYLFIYKAYQTFVNNQTYKHENPMQKDLAKILKRQDQIMKKLGLVDEDESV